MSGLGLDFETAKRQTGKKIGVFNDKKNQGYWLCPQTFASPRRKPFGEPLSVKNWKFGKKMTG